MMRVGILSFSDGRLRVHETLTPAILAHAGRLQMALERAGNIEVVQAPDIVHGNRQAGLLAKWLNAQDLDAVLLNVPVFAFPNYTAIAARLLHVPIAACAPVDGTLPGLGGLQAAVNMIRQSGGSCEKFYGDPEEDEHAARIVSFVRAAHASVRLQGQVYGLIGGRSIGIGSGVAPQDAWMRQFGVDVDHVDELELVRRADQVDGARLDAACAWLAAHLGRIAYDGGKLTPQTLRRQAAFAIAAKDLVRACEFDFVGIKCHYDLSEYQCTQCLTAALLNDPYDWDGPRDPIICACEADSEAALTMRILNLLSGLPALFMDFRHVDRAGRRLTLCNCGAMATYYAARSCQACDNLACVAAVPVIPKYGGVGAHLPYMAKPGAMTFARLSHVMDRYRMCVFTGECVSVDASETAKTVPQWPHMFVKVRVDPQAIVERFDSNHVHAVAGDRVADIVAYCKLAGIQCDLLT